MKEKNEKTYNDLMEKINESCIPIKERIEIINLIIDLRYDSKKEGIIEGANLLKPSTQ